MLQDSSSPRIQFQNLSTTSLYGFDDPLGFRTDHDLLLDGNNMTTTSTNHKIVGNTSNNQGLLSHSSPPLPSSSSSANSSNGFTIHGSSYQSEETNQSLINFKMAQYEYSSDFMHGGGSLLSFQHQSYDQRSRYPNEFAIWEDSNIIGCSSALQCSVKLSNNLSSLDEVNYNCLQTSSGHQYLGNGWSSFPFVDSTLVADRVQDSRAPIVLINKRPHPDEVKSMQGMKKQCTSNSKSTKSKSTISQTKDPQSIAAKNRRERISERLKILQDLVPNGSKVDLVTMLEKAISYVKFLQLQVKVLATDEFWPAAGGKAPDISQVREAIDAILSSHRYSN